MGCYLLAWPKMPLSGGKAGLTVVLGLRCGLTVVLGSALWIAQNLDPGLRKVIGCICPRSVRQFGDSLQRVGREKAGQRPDKDRMHEGPLALSLCLMEWVGSMDTAFT